MYSQVEMVTLEELVTANHTYRKFKELWDFTEIEKEMNKITRRIIPTPLL